MLSQPIRACHLGNLSFKNFAIAENKIDQPAKLDTNIPLQNQTYIKSSSDKDEAKHSNVI